MRRALIALLLAAGCEPGPGELIAKLPAPAQSLSADASGVYAVAGGRLMRVALPGGQPVLLGPGPSLYDADPPLLTENDLIWVRNDSSNNQDGSILTMPKSGGTPHSLASSQGNFLHGLTRDATNLYWIMVSSRGSGASVTSIQTMVIAGGAVSTLLTTSAFINAIAVDDARVYFSDSPAYGGQAVQSAVHAMQKDGTGAAVLWSGGAGAQWVVGRSLFWYGFPYFLYEMDLASSTIRGVARLDGYPIGADAGGFVTLGNACDPRRDEDISSCRSWLRNVPRGSWGRVPAGDEIASADKTDLRWSAAVYEQYVYWSWGGGTELWRVRR